MKFSIITPEHTRDNIPFLLELYESITDQIYTNWEWVLYLNNNITLADIPPIIQEDEKVKIFEDTTERLEVGYFKNKAFHLGTGEILVEVDHDDIITPDCLQELYKVYVKKPQVGFVYSDAATYNMNEEFIPYDPGNGWTYRKLKWREKELIAMNSFPPTSHSMAYIWYAPDHVRSWRKEVYHKVGGHNEELSICDDQDLLARTYLETDFYHIDKVLYIYRITGKNTWLERCDNIQQTTLDVFEMYVRALAERDSQKKGLLNIDIGGGLNPYGDYKTVDLREHADFVADLNDGIPLEDNSVGVLNAHHILEHLKDPIKSMREIHRVLCHGGWAFIEVPSTEGKGAFQDPTHITFWNDNSFLYYTDRDFATFIDNTDIRFQEVKKINYYPNEQMKALDCLITCVVLIAIKNDEQRFPGLLKI
tara:strand:+ start:166 stop:1428 length:1263 start_codon:yes stop_codon:yes gene_type:complete